MCQLGTLGGGNHFIELCLDEEQRVWVMLHSGSRGIGNVFGRYFIAAARKDMQRHQLNLPDHDLAYFSEGSDLFDDYVEAVDWAQDYALLNRREMMRWSSTRCARHLPPFETRRRGDQLPSQLRGAASSTSARSCSSPARVRSARATVELGIIPGSMGAKSYIVRGQGQSGVVSLLLARRGPAHEPYRSEAALQPLRSGDADRRASSAARMAASSTRSRPPTRTSTRSWRTSPTSSRSCTP